MVIMCELPHIQKLYSSHCTVKQKNQYNFLLFYFSYKPIICDENAED